VTFAFGEQIRPVRSRVSDVIPRSLWGREAGRPVRPTGLFRSLRRSTSMPIPHGSQEIARFTVLDLTRGRAGPMCGNSRTGTPMKACGMETAKAAETS
jgi:hypothetical protein